jgi:hypothetical protein
LLSDAYGDNEGMKKELKRDDGTCREGSFTKSHIWAYFPCPQAGIDVSLTFIITTHPKLENRIRQNYLQILTTIHHFSLVLFAY